MFYLVAFLVLVMIFVLSYFGFNPFRYEDYNKEDNWSEVQVSFIVFLIMFIFIILVSSIIFGLYYNPTITVIFLYTIISLNIKEFSLSSWIKIKIRKWLDINE